MLELWQELIGPTGATPALIAATYRAIAQKYAEPGRFYHTLAHIENVLKAIENLENQLVQPTSVKLAGWFHDIIYDSRAKDNEEQSAEYARRMLESLGYPPPLINQVEQLILATKTHRAAPDDLDAQVLLDADLSILGASALVYREYAGAIRQEYVWVADEDYRAGRAKVLQSFLERPILYFTPTARAAWERVARQNLAAELVELKIQNEQR